MKGIENIRAVAPAIANRIAAEGGGISRPDIVTLTELTPNLVVLVRCNNGRFTTPMQNVLHFCNIIEGHYQMKKASGQDPLMVSDYVRDISLLAG